jgi:hypothetical protein
MAGAGYEPELIQESGASSLEAVASMLKKVPPHGWIHREVRREWGGVDWWWCVCVGGGGGGGGGL